MAWTPPRRRLQACRCGASCLLNLPIGAAELNRSVLGRSGAHRGEDEGAGSAVRLRVEPLHRRTPRRPGLHLVHVSGGHAGLGTVETFPSSVRGILALVAP